MVRRAALILTLAMVVNAAGAAAPAREDHPGPAIGSKAPAFTLSDQTGAERTLGSLLGRGKLAIVFYRSADW